MVLIDGKPLDDTIAELKFPPGSVERKILDTMKGSTETYRYDSVDELSFELRLRKEIVKAAKELNDSDFAFEVFRDSRCNPTFWNRRDDGGFELKPGVKASDAIRDIYDNSRKYGTECATAMQIVYYKALLSVYPEPLFNRLFSRITLMNWHDLSPLLRETGLMQRAHDYFPGDRRYFTNPDVDPKTPEWQGENVIELGNGLYYGHGVGIHHAEEIIDALNDNRRPFARREAYLLDQAGRPNFKALAALDRDTPTSVQRTA